ncbi:MAG: hypothetical protein Q8930_11155 [Bacillota bacterium]|nr:hypothetical protein [Bacillota bacterium]
MKRFVPIAFIIIIIISVVDYNYDIYKRKNIAYVLQNKLTKGILNSFKLDSISSYELSYSDENVAVAQVKGSKANSSLTSVSYKVILEKQRNGTWKIKDIYIVK